MEKKQLNAITDTDKTDAALDKGIRQDKASLVTSETARNQSKKTEKAIKK